MFLGAPEAREHQLADEQQLLRQPVVQLHKQLLVREQFLLPGAAVNRHQLVELLTREVLHPAPVQMLVARHPADRALDAERAAVRALDDPLQDAKVLAEARPQEIAFLVAPEPVHAENPQRVRQVPPEVQPVVEVVGHVVAGERQHREWVAAHLAKLARGRGGHLRTHGGCGVHAVVPVESLVNQRHPVRAPATEDERRDRDALRVVGRRVDHRALTDRRGEARVGMCGLAPAVGCPVLAGPVDQVRGGCLGHALPPHVAIVGQRDVGEDGVGTYRRHRVRVGLRIGAGCDTEETCFGVNRSKLAVRPWLDPGDVIANGRHLPALLLEHLGRDEHGEVGLAAGAWEGGDDVGFLALRILDAEDEHMLGQPALVTREH